MTGTGKAGRGRGAGKHSGKRSRSAASSNPYGYSGRKPTAFHEGQGVELLIGERTEIGYRAVINDSCEGLLYRNEVFQPLRRGQLIAGFIKKVREDGKIDLCLQKPGPEKVDDVSARIMNELKKHGGFVALTDKSPAEAVYRLFGASKKTFKKAAGSLYRRRLIIIEDAGIRLAGEDDT